MAIAYISDHQQPVDCDDVADAVLELCRDADLLIHDAQYEPAEFALKSDWGHCTIGYAVRVAAEAAAKRLVLFHHDPSHSDDDIDRLLDRAQASPSTRGRGASPPPRASRRPRRWSTHARRAQSRRSEHRCGADPAGRSGDGPTTVAPQETQHDRFPRPASTPPASVRCSGTSPPASPS